MSPWKTFILLALLLLVGFTLIPGCNQLKEIPVQVKDADDKVFALSSALDSGNDAAVLALLVNSSRAQYRGSLNLTADEEKQLAKDLKGAVAIETYDNAVVYEIQHGSEKFTFFVIKEDGSWKVYGL